jgi:glycine cleavage system H protein
LINGSPYEDGWLVKVKVADLAELDALLSAEEYDQLLAGTE